MALSNKTCKTCIRKSLGFDCSKCNHKKYWADAKEYRRLTICRLENHLETESPIVQKLYKDVIHVLKSI